MTKPKQLPPAEILWDLFEYDPLRGELYWRTARSNFVDTTKPAGWRARNGYQVVSITQEGKRQHHFAHRLIWKWVHGVDPVEFLDHVGQEHLTVKRNHVWGLEDVSNFENTRRSANKTKGVCWHKAAKKWMAQSRWDGAHHYLGLFADRADAELAVARFRARQAAAEWLL